MAKVTFSIPDDFIPTKGAAVLTGWGEDGEARIYSAELEDTYAWDRAMLFREGLRRADQQMNQMWQRTDG